ncbi:hypothetical protein IE53DRAFT_385052 [Violaceomyces palustris]|uniref:Uncharacterized protein n=1 Tax=Violaceomyces palustris TaxID=1673888 RepID=A0ACD0P3J0_9BASI|nr:hypothetical protein IE53DRAFT_385052 [Violaceomyces palustris]
MSPCISPRLIYNLDHPCNQQQQQQQQQQHQIQSPILPDQSEHNEYDYYLSQLQDCLSSASHSTSTSTSPSSILIESPTYSEKSEIFLNPSNASASFQSNNSRIRSSLACLPCRLAKHKCDGVPVSTKAPSNSVKGKRGQAICSSPSTKESLLPAVKVCSRCASLGTECVWKPSMRSGRKPKCAAKKDQPLTSPSSVFSEGQTPRVSSKERVMEQKTNSYLTQSLWEDFDNMKSTAASHTLMNDNFGQSLKSKSTSLFDSMLHDLLKAPEVDVSASWDHELPYPSSRHSAAPDGDSCHDSASTCRENFIFTSSSLRPPNSIIDDSGSDCKNKLRQGLALFNKLGHLYNDMVGSLEELLEKFDQRCPLYLNMVAAMGYRISGRGFQASSSLADFFHARAKGEINRICGLLSSSGIWNSQPPGLCTLSSSEKEGFTDLLSGLILLVNYEYGMDQSDSALHYLNVASKISLGKGLHRLDAGRDNRDHSLSDDAGDVCAYRRRTVGNDPGEGNRFRLYCNCCPCSDERLRRVWWELFMLDANLSTVTNLHGSSASSLVNSSIAVKLPRDEVTSSTEVYDIRIRSTRFAQECSSEVTVSVPSLPEDPSRSDDAGDAPSWSELSWRSFESQRVVADNILHQIWSFMDAQRTRLELMDLSRGFSDEAQMIDSWSEKRKTFFDDNDVLLSLRPSTSVALFAALTSVYCGKILANRRVYTPFLNQGVRPSPGNPAKDGNGKEQRKEASQVMKSVKEIQKASDELLDLYRSTTSKTRVSAPSCLASDHGSYGIHSPCQTIKKWPFYAHAQVIAGFGQVAPLVYGSVAGQGREERPSPSMNPPPSYPSTARPPPSFNPMGESERRQNKETGILRGDHFRSADDHETRKARSNLAMIEAEIARCDEFWENAKRCKRELVRLRSRIDPDH